MIGENIERPSQTEEMVFEKVKLARHPDRPYSTDFIELIFEDFIEMKGDRRFADDHALLTGFSLFDGLPVTIIAQQKGRDTKQRRFRNFGMPKPEGYRKAIRIMQIAEKFERPIITFIDTPGAFPGIDAEERGQAEAIAHNLLIMSRLSVPVLVVIIGEGGSGGALAIGVGDSILMLENAIYSVISPEGCAAILWKDSVKAPKAAAELKLTAEDLINLGLVDKLIKEPNHGAHTSWEETARELGKEIRSSLETLMKMSPALRISRRYKKLRMLGF